MENCNRKKYMFRPPFNAYNDLKLSLESSRSIPEIIQDSGEIENAIYLANNLTAEQYKSDVVNDVKISVFMEPTGGLLYVPETYYVEQLDVSFVQYSHEVIGVELGFIPTLYKNRIPDLTEAIKELVKQHVGIVSQTRSYTVNTTTKSEEEHNLFLASSIIQQNVETTQMKIARLEAMISKLEKDNEDLKCIIRTNVNV